MRISPLDKTNLTLTLLAVTAMTSLFAAHAVFAGPDLSPPNGNPAFPAGLQGSQGAQGLQGNQGNPGNPGSQGPVGTQGLYGIGSCSWNGGEWVSFGSDAGCAWDTGAYFYCDGSRLWAITARNGCSYTPSYPASPFLQ